MAISDPTLARRFWLKVDRRGDDECWPWTAYRSKKGYGHIKVGGKRGSVIAAHRVAYELKLGDIPPGMLVCHSCDNPPCCNPAHLWVGTNDDNMADMARKGRARAGRQPNDEERARGVGNGNAKLTDADVLSIRRDGRTQEAIARDYGVDRTLVGYIQRRKIWTHI